MMAILAYCYKIAKKKVSLLSLKTLKKTFWEGSGFCLAANFSVLNCQPNFLGYF
jgi:hypothetical protein